METALVPAHQGPDRSKPARSALYGWAVAVRGLWAQHCGASLQLERGAKWRDSRRRVQQQAARGLREGHVRAGCGARDCGSDLATALADRYLGWRLALSA